MYSQSRGFMSHQLGSENRGVNLLPHQLGGENRGINPVYLCQSMALQACQTIGNSQKLIIGESGIDVTKALGRVGGIPLGVDACFQLQLEGGICYQRIAHENISFQ